MEKLQFLNTYCSNLNMEEVLAELRRLIPQRSAADVVELNVDVIMRIEKDPQLKRISDEADLTLIDGKPLVWISRLLRRPVKEKISGSDLMPRVCDLAASEGFSVFILGGMPEAAALAVQNLQDQHPGLRMAGSYSPPKGFEKDPEECAHIDSLLQELQPDIVFVCLGCPKQEKWVDAHRGRLPVGVFLCAGASVDFAAGTVKRAPKWMSDHGLEWFFRFLQEPRRLFRRYFIDDMKILGLVFKYMNSGRR